MDKSNRAATQVGHTTVTFQKQAWITQPHGEQDLVSRLAETLPALPLAGIKEQALPKRVASYLAFLRGHSGVWGREDAGLDSGEMLTPLLFHSWNPERDQQ